MHLPNERLRQLTAWLQSQPLSPDGELVVVSGDASFRRYFRYLHQGDWYIAVDAPPPQESLAEFIAVAQAFQSQGVPVPQIHAYNEDAGFMILQDLGDTLLFAQLQSDEQAEAYYRRALALLPGVMRCQRTPLGALPDYSEELLRRELSLFSDWLLNVHLQLSLDVEEQQAWQQACDVLVENARQQPQVGVHRDYHSRNIMHTDNGLALIDFQDAVRGPVTYDAVSLLRDCYVQWPSEMVQRLSEFTRQRLQTEGVLSHDVTATTWQRWFDLMGVQRHCKAAGIFARLKHRDDKPTYMADVPRTLEHILSVSGHYPELAAFDKLVRERVLPEVNACMP
ncbi:aminoglycoside phosphotransferase family protein [Aliidiomarina sp. Khilg15.8]